MKGVLLLVVQIRMFGYRLDEVYQYIFYDTFTSFHDIAPLATDLQSWFIGQEKTKSRLISRCKGGIKLPEKLAKDQAVAQTPSAIVRSNCTTQSGWLQ